MSPRLTHEQFLERAIIKHGKNRYIYKSKYKTAKEKMEIECPICKTTFNQEAYSHLSGCGCPKCSKVNSGKKRTKTHEQFVEQANAIHGEGRYIYKKPYVGINEVLEIWCTVCNKTFEQTPHGHLTGRGCRECGIVSAATKKIKTHEQFVEEANAVHGNGRYIYN